MDIYRTSVSGSVDNILATLHHEDVLFDVMNMWRREQLELGAVLPMMIN